jgi:hypothetical protein
MKQQLPKVADYQIKMDLNISVPLTGSGLSHTPRAAIERLTQRRG